MTKSISILLITLSSILLTACTITSTMNRHRVAETKLTTGKHIKIIWRKSPEAAWQCKKKSKVSYNWAMESIKGEVRLKNGYTQAEKEVTLYANKHHINANLATIRVPTQINMLGLDVTALSKAHITYYLCKSTPKTTYKYRDIRKKSNKK